MDRVYGMVDRVHGAGSWGLRILIKRWSSNVGWEAEINPGEMGISLSNLSHWSGDVWLTAAPASDGGVAMRRAAVPWPPPARRLDGYVKLFWKMSSPTWIAWGGNTPRVFLGGDGYRRVDHDGGRLAPFFDDGRACPVAIWLDQDNGQLPLDVL
jgi:hypothetical protein